MVTTTPIEFGTSPTAKPGYILNPDLGVGSNTYWQDAAVSALAYKWATATPEERSTFLGNTWVTAQFGSPDATDGVDANGRVYTSPQTTLALTKYIQSGAAANDPWIISNLGAPPPPAANEYIESPEMVSARINQANLDRAHDLNLQQEARLAASDARSAQIASQQIAASQANAALAAQASMYGSDKQLEGTKYASDQGLKGSVFGTLGQYLSSVYGTQENNRLGALEAGGTLAGNYQGLLDSRTNRYIDLRSDPSDIVAREYTSRAIMKPEGYEGPLYNDVPELQQALSRLLGWTPQAAPDLNALLSQLGISGGGSLGGGTTGGGGSTGGGTTTGGGGGSPAEGGLSEFMSGMRDRFANLSPISWNRSAVTANAGTSAPAPVPSPVPGMNYVYDPATGKNVWTTGSYGAPGSAITTTSGTPPGTQAWNTLPPTVAPGVTPTAGTSLSGQPFVADPSVWNQQLPMAAFGGRGLSHAVVGDPQQPGRPNPELVVGDFDVIPLNKMPLSAASRVMQNSPKMAYGNIAWNSTQGYYDTTTGQSVAQPGTETPTYEPAPTQSSFTNTGTRNVWGGGSNAYGDDQQQNEVPTQPAPAPAQPAPTSPPPATTTTPPPPPPAQVNPGTSTTPAPTPTTPAPVNPVPLPTGQLPPGTPPMTSYPDEVYQNLPALQFLRGNMPLSAYNTAQTGLQNGAFGTQMPGLGGLNLARLSEIAKSPESLGTLESLYKSANMNLSDLIARAAARFGAPGTNFRTNMIET